MLAVIVLGEWLVALPFIAVWIFAISWAAKSKRPLVFRGAALLVLAVATVFAFSFVVERVRAAPRRASLVEAMLAPGPVEFAQKHQMTVPTSSQAAYLCEVEWPARLQVDVVEIYGKNIEFRVLQDGKPIAHSGVHAGRATGLVDVAPGTVTISVVNDNMLEGKVVQLSAIGSPR